SEDSVSAMEIQRLRSKGRGELTWKCMGWFAEEMMHRRSETAAGEFAERLFCEEKLGQTHFGKNAQRDERDVGRICLIGDIMATDSVQRGRSEREFRCGSGGHVGQTGAGAEGSRPAGNVGED